MQANGDYMFLKPAATEAVQQIDTTQHMYPAQYFLSVHTHRHTHLTFIVKYAIRWAFHSQAHHPKPIKSMTSKMKQINNNVVNCLRLVYST